MDKEELRRLAEEQEARGPYMRGDGCNPCHLQVMLLVSKPR